MTDLALLFGSTFGVVFFLGFQSLCVNSGNYWLAGLNSLMIGTFNLVLFKTVPQVHSIPEIACYLFGGPLGILSAMWVHRNVVAPWREYEGQRRYWKMVGEVCAKYGFKQVK